VRGRITNGVMFGDVAGSTLEFEEFDSDSLPEDAAGLARIPGSRKTDDTVATLATEECLKKQKAELDQLYEEWRSNSRFRLQHNPFTRYYKECVRKNTEAGWGWHFMDWALSENAEPYQSHGDGAAMRVAPIGAMYDDPDQVIFTAAVSAATSHNHPDVNTDIRLFINDKEVNFHCVIKTIWTSENKPKQIGFAGILLEVNRE